MDTSALEKLRNEFNRWAEAGRGEEMEEHHRPIVLPTLALMELRGPEKILDLGCGSGWLCRLLASELAEAQVVGVDVSDEMIRRAREASSRFTNLAFQVGGAERIPAQDNFFTKVISVESAYYWPDPARGLGEIFRVLAPGGSAWILINYYRDNPQCHQWGALLDVPAHLLSAKEWAGFYKQSGFTDISNRRIPDESPTPEVYTGRWFRDAEQMRRFKQEGALLVWGAKPARNSD